MPVYADLSHIIYICEDLHESNVCISAKLPLKHFPQHMHLLLHHTVRLDPKSACELGFRLQSTSYQGLLHGLYEQQPLSAVYSESTDTPQDCKKSLPHNIVMSFGV